MDKEEKWIRVADMVNKGEVWESKLTKCKVLITGFTNNKVYYDDKNSNVYMPSRNLGDFLKNFRKVD